MCRPSTTPTAIFSAFLSLQWYDDLLHAFSGVWALIAAFVSHRQSVLYFKLFGSVYLFDGVLGLVTGSGCLDGGIFINGFRSFDDIEFPTRFFANAPHLAIGGFAVFVGFWLSKRVHAPSRHGCLRRIRCSCSAG